MPTRYLLDSNAVTELALGNSVAWAHIGRMAPGDSLWTCFVVAGEWEYGLNAARTPARRAQIASAGIPVFATLSGIWESSPAVAQMYGSIHASLRAAGAVIPTNDIWIAAVALTHGATVVTSDAHLARVPALRLVDWSVP